MIHYLDNAATTVMYPQVIDEMVAVMNKYYGNPSGAHRLAREANQVLDESREQMAGILGVETGEIVFTSGGSESNNLAIRGAAEKFNGISICSAIEHDAVLEPVEHLSGKIIGVDSAGQLDIELLKAALTEHPFEVSLVSVMALNNETGVLQPIKKISETVRELAPKAILHCDAVQAFCWTDIKNIASFVDLLSLSAHKFGGPKGVGALIIKDGCELVPQILGGGQERDRRAGTHNVAGIRGMSLAAKLTDDQKDQQIPRVRNLRDSLSDAVLDSVPGSHETGVISGNRDHKAANISHFCFEDIESEALLFLLERAGVMASAASSCASGAQEPSHVLSAMGIDKSLAKGSIRLSLGFSTTEEDVQVAVEAISGAIKRLREYD